MSQNRFDLPVVGGRYRHFKGDIYLVIANAQIEASKSERYNTIYVSLNNYKIYSRDTAIFQERVDFLSNPEYINMMEGSQPRFLFVCHPTWCMRKLLSLLTNKRIQKLLGAVSYESR